MNHQIQLVGVALALLSQATMADSPSSGQPGAGPPERVLHFPSYQAVGQVSLIDESYIAPEISTEPGPGYASMAARYWRPAQGDVRIPAGKGVYLRLGGLSVGQQQCIEVLKSLEPNDVQALDFLQPLLLDDAILPYVARLKGLTSFCPLSARFTAQGWLMLQSLPRLEHLCAPYGLTDAEMASIATLQTLEEVEILDARMTNTGLASIGQLHNLQVLWLESTAMVTNEGLKTLAALPKLRSLRLAGQFTNQGLAYLAAAPSLKTLWLDTPRATEQGLGSLAQIQSLERLYVPWLDQVTNQSIAYFKSMSKLRALGVGDAWSGDGGMVLLASLTNLEVLAVKGGPNLTDNGLRPLAGMPKLRVLEIHDSQVTEQGLVYLSACKKLESIHIRSSAPISQQAIAHLRTELAGVQTLDISQPQAPIGMSPLPVRQP